MYIAKRILSSFLGLKKKLKHFFSNVLRLMKPDRTLRSFKRTISFEKNVHSFKRMRVLLKRKRILLKRMHILLKECAFF